ncbi:uncharacterized protein Dwil_GK25095 [Drosophila willistoni]|uniref:EF-hand domain-containing protein n=1 Tax=Drosophila willistoni TaxID=7260 RepID=B4NCE6_DROWI|nr:calmodulin-3 [Drosophila willistoni]EDW82505.1 uncharacterized protein Dwil_GK25095 [Drosophila willistoni]
MEHNKKVLIAELKEVYTILTDSGLLTIKKLRDLMVELGHPVTEIELKEMINAVDENGQLQNNGQFQIDFNSFCRVMLMAEREEQLKKFVKIFDKDKDGCLNKEELRQALTRTLGEEIDVAIINEMMKEADTDGDGRLSYDELLRMFSKYSTI